MTKESFRQQCLRKKRIYQILICNSALGTFILPRILQHFHIPIPDNTLELVRGLILGGGIVSFILFVRLYHALEHPNAFDTFHIQETDERNLFIKQKTTHTLFYIALFLILLNLLLVSATSTPLFELLLVSLTVLAFCKLVIRYYYASKY